MKKLTIRVSDKFYSSLQKEAKEKGTKVATLVREKLEGDKNPPDGKYDVVLTSFGSKKINTIRCIREITSMDLKEAKEFVESCPRKVRKGLELDEAEELKAFILNYSPWNSSPLSSYGVKVDITPSL